MGASHDHYFVPLRRRDVVSVLEISAGQMGLVVRDDFASRRRVYPRDISRAF